MNDVNFKKIDLELWMKEYGTSLLRISYLYTNDRALAEDITQETFIKAYQNYDSFQQKSSVKTWLTRIAINLCKDNFKKTQTYAYEPFPRSEGYLHVETELSKKEDKKLILDQIQALDSKYREVILLYYYKEFSIKEIAEILVIPENTVSTRLSRGRKLLKQVLKGWWENEK